jgi:general secretion pathway protein A
MSVADLDACYHALGLTESPFRITPDIQFFCPHNQYLSALGHMHYGMLSGAFTVLTAEVGLGKTLLCRHLLRNLPPGVRSAYIYNPQITFIELMRSIILDLGVALPDITSESVMQRHMLDMLVDFSSKNIQVAVLIDEAHKLSPAVLEGLRLLSNLETDKQKLLSLVLVGQPELEIQLKTRQMRALYNRISIWHRLRPFTFAQMAYYITHRLNCARSNTYLEFTLDARLMIYFHSAGVPRRINLICERSLLLAYVKETMIIDAVMVQRAALEISGKRTA